MGLLERGQQYLNRTLAADVGRLVTYSRTIGGVARQVELTAWPGRTIFSGLQESAVSVQRSDRDYLIRVAELALPDALDVPVPTTPMQGDRVTDQDGTFELFSPQTEEPVWRYADNFRTLFRVHTQRVG